MKKNIVLIGFMGTGKTTVSRKLSEMLDIKEIDVDAYIVEREQKSINDIFKEQGEEGFRDIETASLDEIKNEKGIISCGGGAVLRDKNVEILKTNGKIVLLTATPQTIYERVKDDDSRPLLKGNMNVDHIKMLMDRRKDRYIEVADVVIETDNKDVDEIAAEIIEYMGNNS